MKNNQEKLCATCPRRSRASRFIASTLRIGRVDNACPGSNIVDYIRTTERSLMDVDMELYGPERLQKMKDFYENVGFDYEANNRGREITNTHEERLTLCNKESLPILASDEKIGQIFENSEGRQYIKIQRGSSFWPLSFSLDKPSQDQIYPPIEES